jgi:hypothetical protein
MTVHQGDIEKARPSNETAGKNGPGLGGSQEGIERSGPPQGMAGGDTSLHSGVTEADAGDNDTSDEGGA